jgi:hypothetical protein
MDILSIYDGGVEGAAGSDFLAEFLISAFGAFSYPPNPSEF